MLHTAAQEKAHIEQSREAQLAEAIAATVKESSAAAVGSKPKVTTKRERSAQTAAKLKYGDSKSKEIRLFVDGWGRAFLSKDKSNVRGSIPRSLAQEADMLTLTPPGPKTRTSPFEICFI